MLSNGSRKTRPALPQMMNLSLREEMLTDITLSWHDSYDRYFDMGVKTPVSSGFTAFILAFTATYELTHQAVPHQTLGFKAAGNS